MNPPLDLSPDYRFLAIIGHPIAQSLSPFIHNIAFQSLGLHFLYSAYDIAPAGLQEAVGDLKKLGFVGFNVTLPHKEEVIPLLDGLDFESKTIGAVNTVARQGGQFIGYNTDVFGVLKSLEPHKKAIEGKKTLLLGAGGAARAVLYALKKYFKPSEITIAARAEHKARAIVKALNIENAKVINFDFEPRLSSEGYSLIVNSTPVGMYPASDASPLPESFKLADYHIVFDLIYRPLETTLLKRARHAGAHTMSGIEMFLHQGAKAFETWTGEKMPMEEVRKALEEKLKG